MPIQFKPRGRSSSRLPLWRSGILVQAGTVRINLPYKFKQRTKAQGGQSGSQTVLGSQGSQSILGRSGTRSRQ